MKLTKTQYKKLEKLIRIADSKETGKSIKLQINYDTTQKIWEVIYSLCEV